MNANSISVHNLRKRFPGFLLDDISFQVPCGRIVGFIGENGAGKSTTIKLILDQLRRDGGSIEIFGSPRNHNHSASRNRYSFVYSLCHRICKKEITTSKSRWI